MGSPPSARGSLSDTPLAQLLLKLCEEHATGSLELLTARAEEMATVVFTRGRATKVRTSAGICYLGSVLYELGYITSDELDASLLELAKARRPHGRILLERGTITLDQLATGLREQILRKLTHLFTFGSKSTFSFHPDTDLLPEYGGRDMVLVDPMPAIWRGIRDTATAEHVRALLTRLGTSRCRLVSGSAIERFQFQADEQSVVECLRIKPMSVAELHGLGVLPPASVGLLVYCLLLSKQLEPQQPAPERSISGPRPTTTPFRGMLGAPTVLHMPANTGERARAILERVRTIHEEDYFRRLNVGRDASRLQIDRAFSALAAQWDPSALPPELLSVRQDCARILLAIGEAYQTLTNPTKREAYTKDLTLGKARLALQRDLAASGAKEAYAGAKACLARNDTDRALRLARSARTEAPDAAAPLALVAWIEAIDPANQSVEATLDRIAMLDQALAIDPICKDALYFRSQLHARLENHRAALRDLKILLEVDANHPEGLRAFRLYQLRIRRGSIRMRAVDPNLVTKPAAASGVVVRVGSVPPGRVNKRGG
ncbi:MAG: hypothetical protein HOV80_39335 [Polyangiaceae bacterium]|nr:hypothetical protein [Polyangiaceae bacterium]